MGGRRPWLNANVSLSSWLLRVSRGESGVDLVAQSHKPKVAIVYTHFPHYRAAVFDQLRLSTRYSFRIFYDHKGVDPTILSAESSANDRDLRTLRIWNVMIQPGLLRTVLSERYDVYVFLGNPYVVSTWIYSAILRILRRKVVFWTHGWIRGDEGLKGAVRSTFYGLADLLLLYGERAKRIGLKKGFPGERLKVIFNSLDYAGQKRVRESSSGDLSEVPKPYFLCVARLVPEVQLDLAIRAVVELEQSTRNEIRLVVVGDGPERRSLEALASDLSAPVDFLGPIYNEERLAGLFLNCSAVVSPGKVGLLAMHAMAYGAPVVTHGDLDHQMPEVEAISVPVSGALFERGNVASLREAMAYYILHRRSAIERTLTHRIIENNYTPHAQCLRIESALGELLDGKFNR